MFPAFTIIRPLGRMQDPGKQSLGSDKERGFLTFSAFFAASESSNPITKPASLWRPSLSRVAKGRSKLISVAIGLKTSRATRMCTWTLAYKLWDRGWRAGSAVDSLCCFCKELGFNFPEPSWWLTIICNPSFRGPNQCTWCTYMHAGGKKDFHTYKVKINKSKIFFKTHLNLFKINSEICRQYGF